MKSKLYSFLSSGLVLGALALGIAISSATANAQNIPLASADIPFSFQVGEVVLPAGTYTFSQKLPTVVVLQNSRGTQSIYTTVRPANKTHSVEAGSIVFARYGNRYFLRQVDGAGSRSGYKCLKTSQETTFARAMNIQNATQVAVNVAPTLP